MQGNMLSFTALGRDSWPSQLSQLNCRENELIALAMEGLEVAPGKAPAFRHARETVPESDNGA